ncbi:MAG: hypothetical protein R6T98_00225 [Desulfatiglandales bacterium]
MKLFFNPDYAAGIVTRVEKPQRNEKLERFCAEGIFVNMLRSKIVKSRQGSKVFQVAVGGYCIIWV